MLRVIVGVVMLLVAAVLVAYAGGVDVTSAGGWASAKSAWTVPSKEENEKCLVLLAGLMCLLMAVVRFLTPTGKIVMAPRVEA